MVQKVDVRFISNILYLYVLLIIIIISNVDPNVKIFLLASWQVRQNNVDVL